MVRPAYHINQTTNYIVPDERRRIVSGGAGITESRFSLVPRTVEL